MKAQQFDTIEAILAEIQQKWGHKAIQVGHEFRTGQNLLSTGFAELDDILLGGLPRGHAVAYTGFPTSGITTLAYYLITRAQSESSEAVYIDLSGTFNAAYAVDCGVDLERLLIARPPDTVAALDFVRDIAQTRIIRLIILDVVGASSYLPLQRLALKPSGVILLILSRHPVAGTQIKLHMACTQWLQNGRDIVGCHLQARLQKHPSIPSGRIAQFPLRFGDKL